MSLIFTRRNPSGCHIVFYSWSYLNDSATNVASNLKGKVLCIFALFSSVASIATEIRGNCKYSVCCMTVSLWNGHTHSFSCSKHYPICPSYPSLCQKVTDPMAGIRDANILWLLTGQPASTIDKLRGSDSLTFLVWVYCKWNHHNSRASLLVKSYVLWCGHLGLQEVGRESLLSPQTIWDLSALAKGISAWKYHSYGVGKSQFCTYRDSLPGATGKDVATTTWPSR